MYILAVDDERYALDTLVEELSKVFPGMSIHEESRPSAAIEWAQNLAAQGKQLDYAFLDIQMWGMSGLELARQLKLCHPKMILFFCTAHSEHAYDAFGLCAKGYILKPVLASEIERVLDEMVTDWRSSVTPLPLDIRVQTFGHFEVFVNGQPLSFDREKAKELLAYLVDRRGSSVTTEQLAAILWEDAPYDRKLKNRTTTIISSLRATLREVGAEDILIKSWNHLAIDTEKFRCDAYDYEKWDAVAVNSFHGEYMTNYSWAEFTTGKLLEMKK